MQWQFTWIPDFGDQEELAAGSRELFFLREIAGRYDHV